MRSRTRLGLSVLALLVLAPFGSCTGVPDGVNVVTDFEVHRYLGTWYEIARLDHRFERGLSNVTADYSMLEDSGVRVVNRGFNDAKAEWKEVVGRAYFIGDQNVGRLKVSFFGPFYGAYNILALDEANYRYSLVVGPDRSYLWILSRTPEMDPDTLRSLVGRADDLGFAVDDLVMVRHDRTGG